MLWGIPGSLSFTPLRHFSLIWIGWGVRFQSTFHRLPLLPPYWPSARIRSPYMVYSKNRSIRTTIHYILIHFKREWNMVWNGKMWPASKWNGSILFRDLSATSKGRKHIQGNNMVLWNGKLNTAPYVNGSILHLETTAHDESWNKTFTLIFARIIITKIIYFLLIPVLSNQSKIDGYYLGSRHPNIIRC